MKLLEEPTRHVIEEYRRRFSAHLDLAALELDYAQRSRFVAALELALQRNMPLSDYELQEFEVSRVRRAWLRLKRHIARLAVRRPFML